MPLKHELLAALGAGNVPDLTQSLFLIYPLLYSAVYGRFLLIQLSNVGSIIVQNGMQAFWQVRTRDGCQAKMCHSAGLLAGGGSHAGPGRVTPAGGRMGL